eukprot:gene45044-61023_t
MASSPVVVSNNNHALTGNITITADEDLEGTHLAGTIKLEGDFRALGSIIIQTGDGADTIRIESDARLYGNTFINAGAGNDTVIIDKLQSMITYNGQNVIDGSDADTALDFARDSTGRLQRDRLTIDGQG